ncbi:hypothetical protein VH567_11350 [Sphingomonas sp. 4RDLI-65]|uniref:hypothetical protein n=1 Tax=Sphingomonas sp. 4RDLI-65 TaxID=3111641 RepID=UPI003C20856F
MPTLQYRGFVLPRDYELTTDYNPTVNRTGAQEDPDATFTARIVDSVIFVDVQVAEFEATTSDQLFGYAYDLARIMTVLATIAEGIAFSPFIDEVTLPNGEVKRLLWADRGLSGLCRAVADHGEEAVIDLVISDIVLARTLSDLPIMLVWPHYAPIAAGRVADAVVRMLTGGSSAACWARCREALNVDKPYVKLLTDESRAARHGDRVYVPGPTVREIAERAWTLLDRYLSLRLSRSTSLNALDFPMLKG